jgi:hypothetical protein
MYTMDFGEIINLIIDVALLPTLIIVLLKGQVPRFRFILAGTIFIVISHIATVLEGLFYPTTLNFIEHASVPIAGIFFIIGFFKYSFMKPVKK